MWNEKQMQAKKLWTEKFKNKKISILEGNWNIKEKSPELLVYKQLHTHTHTRQINKKIFKVICHN